jgi:hypothetical protein
VAKEWVLPHRSKTERLFLLPEVLKMPQNPFERVRYIVSNPTLHPLVLLLDMSLQLPED